MPEIAVNGATLTYVDKGHGQPVVLVHGSLSDYRSWRAQVEAFARSYRVIAYSRRYHYPNPWSGDGSDYSALLHAADLAALIRALDIAPAHVVGQSYGAYTSLVCAAKYPDTVRSLVLGEPPIMPWLESLPGGLPLRDAFLADAWQPATEAFRRGDLQGGVRLFMNGVSGTDVFSTLPAAARATLLDNAPEMRAETRSAHIFPAFTPREAATVKVPVLILSGEQSPRLFHVINAALAACLPQVTQATIPGASHVMAPGNPAAYNPAVLDFLAQQQG